MGSARPRSAHRPTLLGWHATCLAFEPQLPPCGDGLGGARVSRSIFSSGIAGALLLCIVGCGARTAEAPRPRAPSSAAPPAPERTEQPALLVKNDTDQPICYVNFSLASADTWGPDRLGEDEVIGPGEARGWRVEPGAYDVRLLDCEQRTILDQRGVLVEGAGIVLTYR